MDSQLRIEYCLPKRLVWQQGNVQAPELILTNSSGQVILNAPKVCRMENNGIHASILLDFGKEIHGSIQLKVADTTDSKPVRLRIRLGESVGEAMSELYGQNNATNDHAIRDQVISVPWMGSFQTSQSGFRFVRIDLIDSHSFFCLTEICALCFYRDISYRGRFKSDDDLLNRIWEVGAYTVHLNMQEYLWDGIKRDRLVWIGDIHPETMTINSVFGHNPVVPKSLDLVRDTTPLPQWMNGISSYSLWWILVHHSWYCYQGDLDYLYAQKDYLLGLLGILFDCVDAHGRESLPEGRFLDWPSSTNKKAVHAGLHSLLTMTFDRSVELCLALGEPEIAEKCDLLASKLRKYIPDPNGNKQAAALMVLAGLAEPDEINNNLLKLNGCRNMSTFYGYYVLQAMAKAGDFDGALDVVRRYWGGMLHLGATTFWEHFDIGWMNNAARIDEIASNGKRDVHGDYGEHCYTGYRHSLCHGWASGPTAWLSEHVLGIRPLEPGFKKVQIAPSLGNLRWVEGVFPTPYGDIEVTHTVESGRVKTDINAPDNVEVQRDTQDTWCAKSC